MVVLSGVCHRCLAHFMNLHLYCSDIQDLKNLHSEPTSLSKFKKNHRNTAETNFNREHETQTKPIYSSKT